MDITSISMNCELPEFVGTAKLDTIGLVIARVDQTLLEKAGYPGYSSLGVLSSRTGAAGQITAVDEAVKATNTKVLSIELPRDTKGWGGHGNYIVIGGKDLSDVKRAVEISLELINKHAGEVYISQAGHLEFAFSAKADQALQMAFGCPVGKAFGFLCGSPAAIGMVMADYAMKEAPVEIVSYMTPTIGTSHSNEVILIISGTASAVKQSVLKAREIGLSLLISMGSYPESPSSPYL